MVDDESRLFREQMGDVKPMNNDDRVRPARPGQGTLSQKARREAAHGRRRESNPLSLPEQVEELGPHDVTGYKKPGVQEGVFRKLRLGRYAIKARLDLHRVTLADAREQVYQFLRQAHEQGHRTVLITHGKGQHSPTPARLKSYVFHWMAESELVLAWHSAQPHHGGAGSTYVMVRKSPAERQKNREAHNAAMAKHSNPGA